MLLNEIKEGELIEVFTALEEAFTVTSTDFYIIGAVARDVWEKYRECVRWLQYIHDALTK